MPGQMEKLGIDRFTPAERLDLALDIWESLDATLPPAKPSDDRRRELARRDAEFDADPAIALTWEQIRGADESR